MANFVLIHGGSHGGWCWERIVPLLNAKGHTVFAPDLPGAGDDTTPLRKVTMADRVRHVAELVTRQSEQVILVGHSLGGPVISEVAEAVPDRLGALVYLAAFMLKNGESMWDAAQRVSYQIPELIASPDGKAFHVGEGSIEAFFYNTTTLPWLERAKTRLREESSEISAAPVHVTAERFGTVPRYYIETLQDRACVPEIQRLMQADWPCRKVFRLDTDHSPFYSAPEELSSVLEAVAAEVESDAI